QPRVDRIERLQLIDREIATQSERDVQADRRMSLAEDEAIALRPSRIPGIDAQEAEVQSREHIGGGQRTTEMSRARVMHGRDDQLPDLARLLSQVGDGTY